MHTQKTTDSIYFALPGVKTGSIRVSNKNNFIDFNAYKVNCEQFINPSKLVPNKFVAAIDLAFSNHYNLCLSPDDFWLTLCQGFAQHINLNSEKYRNKFVDFDGKKVLKVIDNTLVKGCEDEQLNKWNNVIDGFTKLLKTEMNQNGVIELIKSDFSTTGEIELTASQITLMDTVQKYFKYEVYTMCGIPQITLLGKTEDWIQLKEKFNNFAEYDLDFWVEPMNSVLNMIIHTFNKASRGAQQNLDFWKSIYKMSSESGSNTMTGWINLLFPYIYDKETQNFDKINPVFEKLKTRGLFTEVFPCHLPNGVSNVPFLWNYCRVDYNMEFVSGFLDVGYDGRVDAVCPAIGYGVKEKTNKDSELPLARPYK